MNNSNVVVFCSLLSVVFFVAGSFAIYRHWNGTSPQSFANRSFGGLGILASVLFGLIALFEAYGPH